MTTHHDPANKTNRRRAPRLAAAALSLAVAAFGAHSIASATLAASGPSADVKKTTSSVATTGPTQPTVGFDRGPDKSQSSPQLHRPGQPQVAEGDQGGARWASMAEFMTFVIQSGDAYWTEQFINAGYGEPTTTFSWPAPGEVLPGACGPTSDNSASYCGGDNTITVSQDLAIRVWNGSLVGPDGQVLGQPGGDMGVALIIAHELAHSMQNKLGLLNGSFSVPATEQHADCWAGVWTRHASDSGLLDPGDIREGENAAWLIGDSNYYGADHHGTSQSRVAAFDAGFNAGYPSACDAILNAPGL